MLYAPQTAAMDMYVSKNEAGQWQVVIKGPGSEDKTINVGSEEAGYLVVLSVMMSQALAILQQENLKKLIKLN